MRSFATIIIGLFAAGALTAPIKGDVQEARRAIDYEDDAFRYSDNIDNAVDVKDTSKAYDYEDDAFRYTDNIDNAVDLVEAPRATDYEDDAFRYSDNIDNAVDLKDAKESSDADADAFKYTDNINNAADLKDAKSIKHESWEHVVTDADGTKVLLTSPYADDVRAADRASILGE
ncbi:hypothetical protein NPX13_g7029 [Xylaria arbuscula]|uniref:Uncharacterized protein n=1 Tax=Xylaria arbuscula TaxID=114810 RepID=A0A9W8NBG3_9PEZI|nr:hypothetical protein NPX13_g7029 [Xylaria arbuscula]